jgi:hypothetical protein
VRGESLGCAERSCLCASATAPATRA